MAAFCIGLRTPTDTAFLTVFICAGIARLARFNATVALVPKDETGKSKYFEGMPIPSSLMLVGVMAECVRRGWIEGPGGRGAGLPWGLVVPLREKLGVDVHYASFVFLFWASLMISKTLRCAPLFLRRGTALTLHFRTLAGSPSSERAATLDLGHLTHEYRFKIENLPTFAALRQHRRHLLRLVVLVPL